MLKFTFSLESTKMKSGLLMGVCNEFPFIIVKGENIDSLWLQVQEHIINYVNRFPERAQETILSLSKKAEENNININNDELEKENQGTNHEKLLTIPIKR